MFVKVLSWDKTGHSGLTLLRLLVLECTRDCSVPYITLPWEVSITSLPSRPSSQLRLLPRLCFSERWWGDSSPSGKSLTSHCHLVKSTSSVLAVTRVTQLGTPQLLTATARLCFPFSGEVTYSNTAALNIAETLCWLQAIKISPHLLQANTETNIPFTQCRASCEMEGQDPVSEPSSENSYLASQEMQPSSIPPPQHALVSFLGEARWALTDTLRAARLHAPGGQGWGGDVGRDREGGQCIGCCT